MNTRWGNSGKEIKEEKGRLKKIKMMLNFNSDDIEVEYIQADF